MLGLSQSLTGLLHPSVAAGGRVREHRNLGFRGASVGEHLCRQPPEGPARRALLTPCRGRGWPPVGRMAPPPKDTSAPQSGCAVGARPPSHHIGGEREEGRGSGGSMGRGRKSVATAVASGLGRGRHRERRRERWEVVGVCLFFSFFLPRQG